MRGTEATVREAVRRFDAGESLTGVVAAGYLREGDPIPFIEVVGGDADQRAAGFRRAAEVRWSDEIEVFGTHALASAVWVHTASRGGGSAGRFWVVLSVRDDLVVAFRYFHDESAARACVAGLT